MGLIPLGPGEFTLADKLQPAEYIHARAAKLRDLYGSNPALAQDLISMIYPHEAVRPWTHDELKEKLDLGSVAKAASEVLHTRPLLFQKFAAEFLASQFPSLAAAFDTYQASRAQQAYADAQRQAQAFPALHSTQPGRRYAGG